MSVAQKIAGFVGIAMVITSLTLKGRSTQEAAVLSGFQKLATGTISAAEGN
jgi:hypothetical protein